MARFNKLPHFWLSPFPVFAPSQHRFPPAPSYFYRFLPGFTHSPPPLVLLTHIAPLGELILRLRLHTRQKMSTLPGKGFYRDIRVLQISNRVLLLKSSRNEFEHSLFERKKLFYEKVVPIFKILCKLAFSEKFSCPQYYGVQCEKEQKTLVLQYLSNHSNKKIADKSRVRAALRIIY